MEGVEIAIERALIGEARRAVETLRSVALAGSGIACSDLSDVTSIDVPSWGVLAIPR